VKMFEPNVTEMSDREEVAIVGMAGRFPGARNIGEFWENLQQGIESIRPFTLEELKANGVDEQTFKNPDFVNSGAVLEDADSFDAAFFGMSKHEAEITDPQHRIFLEVAWEALEHAGYTSAGFPGRIGIFGGIAPNTYYQKYLAANPHLTEKFGSYALMIASEREYAVTRVAFKMNLTGPAVNVNTACSTSGVAIHLACQSILSGESDMALAGGARIRVPLCAGYIYHEDGILSPDGHCRAFDAQARGTVAASGAAFIVLKRLSDARRDGDTIYALIKGTAVNNDGANKIGYTAPSVRGQAAVIREALAMAEVSAETIGYVEAHGTGTSLGDPIEIAALTEAYRHDTEQCGYCAIGSLKTNIGHLDAGAGVAGVIKAAMALRSGQIPPSLNFKSPNPQINFSSSPFYVNDKLSNWPDKNHPRRAAVSSFGLGGTNAHIILEEPPAEVKWEPESGFQLLIFSAKTQPVLDNVVKNLARDLVEESTRALSDVSYTLQIGRSHFEYRQFAVGKNIGEVVTALNSTDVKRPAAPTGKAGSTSVVFMFSGQGSQYLNMTRGLYERYELYRAIVDRCASILQPFIGLNIRDLIFSTEGSVEEASMMLRQTQYAQPALFVVEYALAELLISWDIQPAAMVGHSIGEYVAACLAGVMQLDEVLGLVAQRGQLMQSMPKGDMLAIPRPENEVIPLLKEGLDLAAVNGPLTSVVAGRSEDIDALQKSLLESKIYTQRLETSHAFHSAMMDPIVERYIDAVRSVKLSPATIPIVSNLTGTWLTAEQATDPSYWGKHLRRTVRFSDCIKQLQEDDNRFFLEVGPGKVLSSLVRQRLAKTKHHLVAATTRHPNEQCADEAALLEALGRLWVTGVEPDWRRFRNRPGRHVPLSPYPFERNRYWISRGESHQKPCIS
jgi:phthiocerol/phenolphthiocerol synthesis type-I polyketide synthase E